MKMIMNEEKRIAATACNKYYSCHLIEGSEANYGKLHSELVVEVPP
jgi:hypothetical protein